jgi:hypothetical protein
MGSLYADNRKVEMVSSLGDIDLEIEQQDLQPEAQADILGHALDEVKGVMIYHSNDIEPYQYYRGGSSATPTVPTAGRNRRE